jgi:hypothetical protein
MSLLSSSSVNLLKTVNLSELLGFKVENLKHFIVERHPMCPLLSKLSSLPVIEANEYSAGLSNFNPAGLETDQVLVEDLDLFRRNTLTEALRMEAQVLHGFLET